MEHKQLYEYFNCRSIDELVELVIKKDDRVQELRDFLEISREFLKMEIPSVNSSAKVFDFLEQKNLLFNPEQDTAIIISLDTRYNPLSYTIINNELSMKDIFFEISNGRSGSYFLIRPKFDYVSHLFQQKLKVVGEYLETIGSRLTDTIVMNKKETKWFIYSEQDRSNYRMYSHMPLVDLKPNKEVFSIVQASGEKIERDFSKYQGFKEFMDRYVTNELIGKNALTNEDQIKDLLKIWKQFEGQEELGVLLLDKNYTITSVKMVFKGSVDSSIADPKVVVDLLKDDNVQAFSIFHNHPSGSLEPSQPDLLVTDRFVKISEWIQKPIFDHYIVSTSGITSISESLTSLEQMKIGVLIQQQPQAPIQEKLDVSFDNKVFEAKDNRYQMAIGGNKKSEGFYEKLDRLKKETHSEIVAKGLEKPDIEQDLTL